MTTKEYIQLVDRVVGTKGSLKVPAYWMNRLMKESIKMIEDVVKNIDLSNYPTWKQADENYAFRYEFENLNNYVYNDIYNQVYNVLPNNPPYYPIAQFGTISGTANPLVQPNCLNRITCSEGAIINISYTTPNNTFIINEYLIEIVCNGTPTISFPSSVVWNGGVVPEFAGGTTYLISIVDNRAVFAQFSA